MNIKFNRKIVRIIKISPLHEKHHRENTEVCTQLEMMLPLQVWCIFSLLSVKARLQKRQKLGAIFKWEIQRRYIYILFFFFFFFLICHACGMRKSQARDQLCTTAATQAIAVTYPKGLIYKDNFRNANHSLKQGAKLYLGNWHNFYFRTDYVLSQLVLETLKCCRST